MIVMSDSCCQRDIDVQALEARQRRTLLIVLGINIVTFLLMVAAAFHARSSSLLSGGLDNFGDAVTYALSLAVVGASQRAKAKVAMVKAALILAAAVTVAVQIGWRLTHPAMPLFETIGMAALLNLGANAFCLYLLSPYRHGDVNMASAWERSEEHTSELQSLMRNSYAVFWLKKKTRNHESNDDDQYFTHIYNQL